MGARTNRGLDIMIAATEIIEFDVKYSRLINFILDNVYIVQGDYPDFPSQKEGVFLAESGKYIKKKFSLSGGSVGLFEGKRIGRAKNLEKLEKEKALKEEVKNMLVSNGFYVEDFGCYSTDSIDDFCYTCMSTIYCIAMSDVMPKSTKCFTIFQTTLRRKNLCFDFPRSQCEN